MVITIHFIDKHTSAVMSVPFNLQGKSKEQIKREADEIFYYVPFNDFYQVEANEDLPEEYLEILESLELSPL